MGNTWEYTVVLREPPADRSDMVARVFAMGRSLGYALHEKPYLFDSEGEEHQFASPAECYKTEAPSYT